MSENYQVGLILLLFLFGMLPEITSNKSLPTFLEDLLYLKDLQSGVGTFPHSSVGRATPFFVGVWKYISGQLKN